LAIWAGYAAGLAPILTTLGLLRTGDIETFGVPDLVTLLLAGGVLFAGIGTYQGHDRSRLMLLFLVTLHYSLRAFPSLSSLALGTQSAEEAAGAIGRLIGALFWIGVFGWYFLRPQTLHYYRRPLRNPPEPGKPERPA
jgi:hypothetical protein